MRDRRRYLITGRTALETLESLRHTLSERGGALLLCALNPHPDVQVRRSTFGKSLGADNVLPDFAAALQRAQELAGTPECAGSAARPST